MVWEECIDISPPGQGMEIPRVWASKTGGDLGFPRPDLGNRWGKDLGKDEVRRTVICPFPLPQSIQILSKFH